MPVAPLRPGFLALHSNRSEWLVQTLVDWLAANPLGPLEEEVVLVQSNGMAEWLKMELARQGRVCAAVRVELPARFLWRTYRRVLGREQVPQQSPMDKTPLAWRLMRLLPTLIQQPGYEPVGDFLTDLDPLRLFQLSTRLADLFDQYQVYRPDWLGRWAQGHDVLVAPDRSELPVPAEQVWQPLLWRALLAELSPVEQQSIRPGLHQRVLQRLQSGGGLAAPLPRRVIVFGVSHFSLSTLEALAALSGHSQVLMAVPNPCRFHWGDIMDGRELLRAQRRRLPQRCGTNLADVALDHMHLHAHPLLAAWGRQTRDFIRLLDEFDDAASTSALFNMPRCDLFEDNTPADAPLLRQLQDDIRDLRPLDEVRPRKLLASDRSMVFHVAHSSMRELEILHDQLLDLLADRQHATALQPRDIVVMVPDIEALAPAIRAVFGQHPRQDPRHIPFDIADQGAQAGNPVVGALTWLLHLPTGRCRMSELVDLMAVPAVAAALGLTEEARERLTSWMLGAGVRWGLNAAHRSDLGLSACGEQNSVWFGVRRMLMGYACGASPLDTALDATLSTSPGAPPPLAQPPAFAGIDPYDEVGGLDAELAGQLAHLLDELMRWVEAARHPVQPAVWAQRGRALLLALMKPATEADRQTLAALAEALSQWQDTCALAGFDTPVPLSVARQAWLDALEQPQLARRFRAGGVTFCTLMPMRAIPFEVVCLLGMNEGDYPRRAPRSDFDLMGQPGQSRPGDRSRREDDRQLMLDALLSARRLLYVSWCGQSVRDNTEQPPSVLVGQLRDHVSAVWGAQALQALTTHHPLQPFSRRYFESGSGLSTHAAEWRVLHTPASDESVESVAALAESQSTGTPSDADAPRCITLAQLVTFFRNPVKAFFRETLNVVFDAQDDETLDDEPFDLRGLEDHALFQHLLLQQAHTSRHAAVAQARRAGRLPLGRMGDGVAITLEADLQATWSAWQRAQASCPHTLARHRVSLSVPGLQLDDWLPPLRHAGHAASNGPLNAKGPAQPGGTPVLIHLESGRLLDGKGKPRPERLVAHWLRALACAASGFEAECVVVGRDATLRLAPLDAAQARTQLQTLLGVCAQGLREPLPLPLKTALVQAAGGQTRSVYDGGHMVSAEAAEPCLARVYPDHDALLARGEFQRLAAQVYGPFVNWVAQQVVVQPHPDPELGSEFQLPHGVAA